MTAYNLEHLTQTTPAVFGPIQDDEALLLYAAIRCRRSKVVLEAGGQTGYSARNFLQAVGADGVVFSVDTAPLETLAPNHVTIHGCISTVDPARLPPLDLVFYDCHEFDPQLAFHRAAEKYGIIHDNTLLAIHDTGLHSYKAVDWAIKIPAGWIHARPERAMVNYFAENGWHAVSFHDDDGVVCRHGLTLMQRYKPLELP